MITIVDYGVGNLFSLCSSFHAIGAQAVVSGDPDVIRSAEKLVLPGVGAFEDAARKLREAGLDQLLIEQAKKGVPLLGICLGMQLLFDESLEYGRHQGLGLIPGTIRPIADVVPDNLKIPHMGWNQLHFLRRDCPLFAEIEEGESVYFVHSFYAADCAPDIVCTAEYGADLTAAVQRGCVYGCQFHPEKSGETGLRILRAFSALPGRTEL